VRQIQVQSKDGNDWELLIRRQDFDLACEIVPSNVSSMVKYDPHDEQMTEFGDKVSVVKIDTRALDFLANTPTRQMGG
jgi:hypothetical protein